MRVFTGNVTSDGLDFSALSSTIQEMAQEEKKISLNFIKVKRRREKKNPTGIMRAFGIEKQK